MTPDVPVRHDGKPAFLALLHGFRPGPNGTGFIDLPHRLRLVDAVRGTLLEERTFDTGPGSEVPAMVVDAAALERLSAEVDALAPAFFEGQTKVPSSLASTAARYRADFVRAIQPELIPLYRRLAGEWLTWVGL